MLDGWRTLRKTANILIALDTSGSMQAMVGARTGRGPLGEFDQKRINAIVVLTDGKNEYRKANDQPRSRTTLLPHGQPHPRRLGSACMGGAVRAAGWPPVHTVPMSTVYTWERRPTVW
ncbi:hypothetical protein [Micromonospora sp. NPDC049282]|uniref:hypothetical protein n=1 Tax=Micromonospora sp. NPDC049282 TaxID=3364269 RepID=UPI003722EC80